MPKRHLTTISLILILLVAAGFRFYGLRWEDDLHNYPHPDERHLANTMSRISISWPPDWELLNDPQHSPLNPRRLVPDGSGEHYDLAYGTLPVYLYRATSALLARILGKPELDQYRSYAMTGRSITAVFSLLTVFWVYSLGRQTFDRQTALLGAAFLALCVLHIQLSHFMTVDLLMSAMVTAGLLFCVRFAQRGRISDALGMGAMLGLSMACKFNGITLGAGIAVAHGVAWLSGRRKIGDLFTSSVPVVLLTWAVCFALLEYYAVRDSYTYINAIAPQASMVNGKIDWPFTRQYINTPPHLYQLYNLVAWGMGWPLGVAALGGVIWASGGLIASFASGEGQDTVFRRAKGWLQRWFASPRRAGLLVILGWALPFFAYTARLEVKFLRYMLPLSPLLCLLAAHLLRQLGELLAKGRHLLRPGVNAQPSAPEAVMRWAIPIFVLLATALWTMSYMRVYAQEHPWQAASRWFYQHAAPGSYYTWEAWGDPVPTDLPAQDFYRREYQYRDVMMHIYHDAPPQDKVGHLAGSLRQADYVVLPTPRIYLSVARLPWRYPVEIRYYQLLFTGQLGYELVQKVTALPGLGPFEVDDLKADQSFYDYDHPLVLIFRKTRDLTDREWQTLFAEQLKATPQITREGDEPPVSLPIP